MRKKKDKTSEIFHKIAIGSAISSVLLNIGGNKIEEKLNSQQTQVCKESILLKEELEIKIKKKYTFSMKDIEE